MEILGVKENLFRDPAQISPQRQAEKAEPPPKELERPASPPEVAQAKLANVEETVKALTENINSFMKSMRYSLQFVLEKEGGRVVIKVVDGEGNLIRRIPPEAMGNLSGRVGESLGVVVNQTLE